jgi:hypothetical protein
MDRWRINGDVLASLSTLNHRRNVLRNSRCLSCSWSSCFVSTAISDVTACIQIWVLGIGELQRRGDFNEAIAFVDDIVSWCGL